jgi:hypothetical protein
MVRRTVIWSGQPGQEQAVHCGSHPCRAQATAALETEAVAAGVAAKTLPSTARRFREEQADVSEVPKGTPRRVKTMGIYIGHAVSS